VVIHYGSYWLGLSLGIIVGWFLWRRNKTKVGTPSTSTNSQSDAIVKLHGEWLLLRPEATTEQRMAIIDFVTYVCQQHT